MRHEHFSPSAGLIIGSRPGLDGNADAKPTRMTNQERIARALELLKSGLVPFVKREMHAKYGDKWVAELNGILAGNRTGGKNDVSSGAGVQLILMQRKWDEVFRELLGESEHGYLTELLDVRDRWMRQDGFSGAETDRSLDAAARLLAAIAAPQADDVMRMRADLRRLIFAEQERAKQHATTGESPRGRAVAGLKPWREAVTPHKDITSGLHWQSEFTADLGKAYLGQATADYSDPVEFLQRTHLTTGLSALLIGAIRRLQGQDGSPVMLLEAASGCGKTHALLALCHLFGGMPAWDLPGIEPVLAKAQVARLPQSVKRVVLVGSRISPGDTSTKEDGTVVRTLWGELAWQLGAKAAYECIRTHDENATNPGDELRKLIGDHSPCVILIDDWLPYIRQLSEGADLPAGHLDTHLAFVRSLIDAARRTERCLLAVALPPLAAADAPSGSLDDEAAGSRSQAVLSQLRSALGEPVLNWAAPSKEDSCRIVHHRLFEPLAERESTTRDRIVQAFAELYRKQPDEFPPECQEAGYQDRLKSHYPLHLENFDQLYGRWSTLPNYQHLRGMLRFMAAAIESLWESGDRSPLILPGNLPIDDARVRHELVRCLPQQWEQAIESEIDGPEALPRRIDKDVPEFGRVAACQRVAQAVFLGTAPTSPAGGASMDDRRIKLACAMPNEGPKLFGDALLRLAAAGNDGEPEATPPAPPALPALPVPTALPALPALPAEDPSMNVRAEALKSKLELVATKVDNLVMNEAAHMHNGHNGAASTKAEESGDEAHSSNGHAEAPAARPFVYTARVALDPMHVGRDAGLVSGEIIFPLSQLAASSVTVVLEIRADVPGGIPDHVVRAVTNAGRKLNLTKQEFESH